jgi:hypothetical protein
MILSKVVLPLPLGPRSPNTEPRGTSKDTLSSAFILPNDLDKLCICKTDIADFFTR